MQKPMMIHAAINKQIRRVRELIATYEKTGPSGAFAADMMERALQQAAAAIASKDDCKIIEAYERLKGFIK